MKQRNCGDKLFVCELYCKMLIFIIIIIISKYNMYRITNMIKQNLLSIVLLFILFYFVMNILESRLNCPF